MAEDDRRAVLPFGLDDHWFGIPRVPGVLFEFHHRLDLLVPSVRAGVEQHHHQHRERQEQYRGAQLGSHRSLCRGRRAFHPVGCAPTLLSPPTTVVNPL
eukprot:scaffold285_cov330-Pavlova_lutheri.AAC.149